MEDVLVIFRWFYCITITLLCLSAQAKVNVHELFLEGNSFNDYSHVILQDKSGFLWIATDNGLKRYDGYQLTGFDNHPNVPFSVGNNIQALLLDNDGSLWAGGTDLIHYLPSEDKFTAYPVSDNAHIWAMFRDANDVLWIGGEGFGLRGIDVSSGEIIHELFIKPHQRLINAIAPHGTTLSVWIATGNGLYLFNTDSKEIKEYPLSVGGIFDLVEAKDGRVWIATANGISVLEPLTGQFKHYKAQPDVSGALQSKTMVSVFEDSKGHIWIGSDKEGVYKYLPDSDRFLHLPASINENKSFPPGAISHIFEDKEGSLWFTVANFGVFRISQHLERFTILANNPVKTNSLGFNNVADLHQDASGQIWIATDGGGLDSYDPSSGNFEHFRHDGNDPHSISSNSVLAIAEASNQDIWLGTWGGGISKLNRQTMTFSQITQRSGSKEGDGLGNINVFRIVVDEQDRLLLSVWNRGLQIYDPANNSFETYFPNGVGGESGVSNYSINDIEPTDNGRYWIGGQSGLELFDPKTKTFEPVILPQTAKIFDLYQDPNDLLWIASDNGFVMYDRKNGITETFLTADGLADNFVTSIEADEQGYLWLGTRNGLSRFNPAEKSFISFVKRDGLASDMFNRFSHLRTREGLLYFGGGQGLTVFSPSHLPTNEFPPKVVLTQLKIFQTLTTMHNSELLTRPINLLDTLKLPYNQNHLAFEFTALNFVLPQKNRYRYRLTGLAQEWIDIDSNHRWASFTNLEPGHYTFEVMATNNDGVRTLKSSRLDIQIGYAWWQSWWANLLYILMAGAVIYSFIHWRLYHNKIRQSELKNLVSEKTSELAAANDSILKLNSELEDRVEMRTQELLIKETERSAAEAKLFHMAFHDPLTGLPNRPWLFQQLERYIAKAHLSQVGYALMFIDGDRFKKVNDTHGHTLGDNVLVCAAKQLTSILPSNCHAVRLGGDEFTVLVQDVTCDDELVEIAQSIIRAFDEPFKFEKLNIYFRVSIGLVSCSTQYFKPEEVLRDADIAMYKAKDKGRGCYQMFDEDMRKQEIEISKLEADLYMAIQKDQLFLVFQPIVALDTGQLVSFESLLRWQHPVQGLIPPDSFIPLAEETGQIFEIGLWVIHQACMQLRIWHDLVGAINLPTIAVNISALQLNQPDLIERLDAILAETNIQGKHLKLEITETALMENSEEVNTLLDCLRDRSIELAIDDFGTGYSSLSYLGKLPVQVLKIDRSFVDSLINRQEEHEGALEIVRATISLAHSFNIKVVAEGIETKEQWDFLLANQCDFGQGYFISRPLSSVKATSFIKQALLPASASVQGQIKGAGIGLATI
jgi:diguanylate cyclase (GGDEF)-like protein